MFAVFLPTTKLRRFALFCTVMQPPHPQKPKRRAKLLQKVTQKVTQKRTANVQRILVAAVAALLGAEAETERTKTAKGVETEVGGGSVVGSATIGSVIGSEAEREILRGAGGVDGPGTEQRTEETAGVIGVSDVGQLAASTYSLRGLRV